MLKIRLIGSASIDYVHDRVLTQLQQQSQLWEAADGRLRLVLGIIGVAFAVTLGRKGVKRSDRSASSSSKTAHEKK